MVDVGRVAGVLARVGVPARRVVRAEPSLDDLFIHVSSSAMFIQKLVSWWVDSMVK